MKRTVSGIILLLMYTATLLFSIKPVIAEEIIYIESDGSINPSDAPIRRDGNLYTLTGNITGSIIIERNNMTLDGACCTIQGTGNGIGIHLWHRTNVTVANIKIMEFTFGITLDFSSNNSIFGNTALNNTAGISVTGSTNNTICNNNVSNNLLYGIPFVSSHNNIVCVNNVSLNDQGGVIFDSSSNNIVSENTLVSNGHCGIALLGSSNNDVVRGNTVSNNEWGIWISHSSNRNSILNNTISSNEEGILVFNSSDNTIINNDVFLNTADGISLYNSTSNTICRNNIANNDHGIFVDESSNNLIYHNNFLDNTCLLGSGSNNWDDGYPSGGNYWSDYSGSDYFSGSFQNITGSDGIGDTPYAIDATNQDLYPLMKPLSPEAQVGFKAGDWIKLDYTIVGWPVGTPYSEWLKVKFLAVEGTTATVDVTMHMSDGTEQSQTMTIDVVAGGGTGTFTGLAIPANSTVGDIVFISGYGAVLLIDETRRTYAGTSRTVVYADFSVQGNQLTYYWDKQTGVMVESSAVYPQLNVTATAKATETNMWAVVLLVHNIDTGLDYETIQEAIDAPETLAGHTIKVDTGLYYEPVTVHKSLTLIGEDRSATVINGNGTQAAVTLAGTNITFNGFTIEHADVGVNLGGSNICVSDINVDNCHFGIWARECLQCVIRGNNVNNQTVKKGTWEDFGGCGIALDQCIYCNVTGNNANNDELNGIWVRGGLNNIIGNNANNNMIGIVLDDARNCTVAENNLSNNIIGIELEPAYNCSIYANDITSNSGYGPSLTGSQSNLIYHNNFINNTECVETGLGYSNSWDDNCEGNYWSDYNGTVFDEWGIGYDPYVIDENNTDHYPLMNPYMLGDLNRDLMVNIVDISIIAKAFGSSPEDATWDPHADLDENDEINILDIAMAAKEFGKEWKEGGG